MGKYDPFGFILQVKWWLNWPRKVTNWIKKGVQLKLGSGVLDQSDGQRHGCIYIKAKDKIKI